MIGRLGGLALLLPLASALGSVATPLWLRVALVALWVTAVARPHAAMLALTLLVPLGSWLLRAAGAAPHRCTEALVLATLSGALIAAARPRKTPLEAQRPSVVPPATALCALAVVSVVVMLDVRPIGTRSPWPFLRDAAVYLARDYLVGPVDPFVRVSLLAWLVEGLLLMLVVARHARDGVTRPPQLVAMTACAGALAAVVTLNAAGPFFAMTLLVALTVGLSRRHAIAPRWPRLRQAVWIAVAVLIFMWMWIGRSRMARMPADLPIGGELGIAGLAAFVWLLGVMAVRVGRGLRADPDDRLLIGTAAALGTFVATWMTSRSTLVPEGAYPFWILAGAVLARADGDAQPPYALRADS